MLHEWRYTFSWPIVYFRKVMHTNQNLSHDLAHLTAHLMICLSVGNLLWLKGEQVQLSCRIEPTTPDLTGSRRLKKDLRHPLYLIKTAKLKNWNNCTTEHLHVCTIKVEQVQLACRIGAYYNRSYWKSPFKEMIYGIRYISGSRQNWIIEISVPRNISVYGYLTHQNDVKSVIQHSRFGRLIKSYKFRVTEELIFQIVSNCSLCRFYIMCRTSINVDWWTRLRRFITLVWQKSQSSRTNKVEFGGVSWGRPQFGNN